MHNLSTALALTPGPTTQPCSLIFAIVVVLVLCASLLIRLHAVDLRHNGPARRVDRRHLERVIMAVLGILMLTVLVLFGVLLVWARERAC